MDIRESSENYLETILIISKTKSGVHAVDVAAYTGFTKASVSRALKLLREHGYLTVDGEDHLALTESGLSIANSMYERHMLISRFLQSLGVDEETANTDACRIEHVISQETFEAIAEHSKSFDKRW